MADADKNRKRLIQASSDIYQNENGVVLRMEMPGVGKDGLDIRVDGDKLIIHGKKNDPGVQGEYRLHEIRDCDYYHEYSIDETIDRNKIEAVAKNGIVTINLGVKEAEKPKKIKISVK